MTYVRRTHVALDGKTYSSKNEVIIANMYDSQKELYENNFIYEIDVPFSKIFNKSSLSHLRNPNIDYRCDFLLRRRSDGAPVLLHEHYGYDTAEYVRTRTIKHRFYNEICPLLGIEYLWTSDTGLVENGSEFSVDGKKKILDCLEIQHKIEEALGKVKLNLVRKIEMKEHTMTDQIDTDQIDTDQIDNVYDCKIGITHDTNPSFVQDGKIKRHKNNKVMSFTIPTLDLPLDLPLDFLSDLHLYTIQLARAGFMFTKGNSTNFKVKVNTATKKRTITITVRIRDNDYDLISYIRENNPSIQSTPRMSAEAKIKIYNNGDFLIPYPKPDSYKLKPRKMPKGYHTQNEVKKAEIKQEEIVVSNTNHPPVHESLENSTLLDESKVTAFNKLRIILPHLSEDELQQAIIKQTIEEYL